WVRGGVGEEELWRERTSVRWRLEDSSNADHRRHKSHVDDRGTRYAEPSGRNLGRTRHDQRRGLGHRPAHLADQHGVWWRDDVLHIRRRLHALCLGQFASTGRELPVLRWLGSLSGRHDRYGREPTKLQ